ncbi:unnamed protein product, partial [Prorocentrum cordatum]
LCACAHIALMPTFPVCRDGPGLLRQLHGDCLRLLAAHADCHFTGLEQAARQHLQVRMFSLQMCRNRCGVDMALNVLRRLASPSCKALLQDIQFALEHNGGGKDAPEEIVSA